MTTWASNDDGTVSDEENAYCRLRVKDVGLVITGCTQVQANGVDFTGEFAVNDDYFIPSLRKLALAAKSGGAPAILQIFHAGVKTTPELVSGVVAASNDPHFTAVSDPLPPTVTLNVTKSVSVCLALVFAIWKESKDKSQMAEFMIFSHGVCRQTTQMCPCGAAAGNVVVTVRPALTREVLGLNRECARHDRIVLQIARSISDCAGPCR